MPECKPRRCDQGRRRPAGWTGRRAAGGAAVGLAVWLGAAGAGGLAPEGSAGLSEIVRIPPHPQRPGDADAGREYLLYGDYIGSGLPVGLFRLLHGGRPPQGTALEREGASAGLPHGLNRFVAPGGAEVIAGANCLACHASTLNGEFIIGLGDSLSDWTAESAQPLAPLTLMGRALYRKGTPERQTFEQFIRGSAALQGQAEAPFRGVNPAFRIEEVAAAQRNPEDLSWSQTPVFDVPDRVIASDVPPWWHIRKKQALYYNGMGRGDFATLIQQIGVFGIKDATDAARINESMQDLLAYLYTIEAPEFPRVIDEALAARGAEVFAQNCAGCHGTYGEVETYPNKLVPVEKVGTDPLYARALLESELWRWYNRSWFAGAGPGSWAAPTMAYIAPPLDGIWATAPYLHNGSVPTLAALLDSTTRPRFWKRSFQNDDYDLGAQVGWRYEEVGGSEGVRTYDTTLPGYGAGGHTFGDDLSAAQRRALIEYLKTL